MRTLFRLCLMGLATLLLAGCGVRFAYTQLDWLLPWYLRDFVTLQGEQRSALDRRLDRLLDWHCREQLPDYAALLRDTRTAVDEGALDAQRLDALLARGEGLWDVLMTAVVDDAEALLASLDDAQVAELAGAFERRNAKARKEHLEGSAEHLHARRVERMEKRLRDWFGRLEDPQREQVAAWSRALQPTAEDWLAHRAAWQRALLDLLGRRAGGTLPAGELEPLLRTPQAHWDAAYRARVTHNRALTLSLLADLVNAATPRQRQRLRAELDKLASQFERLACAPSLPAPA